MSSPKIFTVSTPLPTVLSSVTLFQHTWDNKITLAHPEVAALLNEVENTIISPDLILESATTAGNYLFINQGVTDSTGRALRVPVKPLGNSTGIVVSTYFSSNVTNAGKIVWKK